MKNLGLLIGIAVIVALFTLSGYYFFSKNTPSPSPTITGIQSTPEEQQLIASGSSNTTAVREIVVTGSSFKFDPTEIKIAKGEKVKIILKNSGGVHDLKIDGLNVGTKVINAGATDSFEFTADKTETFEYYCSVGNHRQQGMVGKLIVQ